MPLYGRASPSPALAWHCAFLIWSEFINSFCHQFYVFFGKEFLFFLLRTRLVLSNSINGANLSSTPADSLVALYYYLLLLVLSNCRSHSSISAFICLCQFFFVAVATSVWSIGAPRSGQNFG